MAWESTQSFPPAAQLHSFDLGSQHHCSGLLAAPQRPPALPVSRSLVLCENLPGCRSNLRASLLSFHQQYGGLQWVRDKCHFWIMHIFAQMCLLFYLFIYLFIVQPLLQLTCSLGDTLYKTCNYCTIHYNAQCNPCLTL